MKKILITGASGFIGQALCSTLLKHGYAVNASVRDADSMPASLKLDVIAVGGQGAQTDWSTALAGVNCVIHCAARTNVMQETEADALAAYREANVFTTKQLAEQAAELGVQRLVFLSSIKVNGEQTKLGAPFLFSDAPAPEGPYGVSKWEAEQALWVVSAKMGLEVVVVRLPLVYGPWVKGNMLRLLSWVTRGIPLPLKAVRNQRSLMGLANVADLLMHCAQHPAAAGQTFLASDGHDLSTPQLLRLIAKGVNRPLSLLPVPTMILKAGGLMLGKHEEINRLVSSLQVDSGYTEAKLGWNPPFSVDDGLLEMAKWYAEL